MAERIELNPADFVTIDTAGPPGQRTFFLQATQDDVLVTVIIEKMQAAALAVTADAVLEEIGRPSLELPIDQMELIEPFEPLFRAGQISLGYDQAQDRLVIVVQEVAPEEREPFEIHIWITREQTAALARKATFVVESGRPTCPLCGEVLQPGERHVCVRGNGRKHAHS